VSRSAPGLLGFALDSTAIRFGGALSAFMIVGPRCGRFVRARELEWRRPDCGCGQWRSDLLPLLLDFRPRGSGTQAQDPSTAWAFQRFDRNRQTARVTGPKLGHRTGCGPSRLCGPSLGRNVDGGLAEACLRGACRLGGGGQQPPAPLAFQLEPHRRPAFRRPGSRNPIRSRFRPRRRFGAGVQFIVPPYASSQV